MKRFVASITSSLAATWALAVTTGPIVFTYGGDPQVPNYWSGTNCKVEFTCSSVGIPGEPGIVEPTITGYDVLIGGELTKTWRKGSRAPNSPAVSAAIVFDSTHFNNNTLLQIQVKVYTVENGVQGEKIGNSTPEKLVQNRARMLTQIDFLTGPNTETLKNQTQAALAAGKYTVSNRFNSSWNKDHLRTDLLNATIFSLVTHGNVNSPGTRWADNQRPAIDENNPPTESEALLWRFFAHYANVAVYSVESARREGTGVPPGANPLNLPPYNNGNPPCTITYLGACLTGSDAAILQKFAWPLGTRYLPTPIGGKDDNEAVVTYLASPWHPGISHAEHAFWTQLMAGEKVGDVLGEMTDAYNDGAQTEDFEHAALPANMLTILGDHNAKAKSVYGGNPGQWWRLAQ